MKYFTSTLSRQLLGIVVIIFGIILISVGFLLPNSLKPIYEKNLYNQLEQSLSFINENISSRIKKSEIAFIYIYNNKVSASDNLKDVISIDNKEDLQKYLTSSFGKFYYKGNTYYYYKHSENNLVKVALTNDSYIKEAKKDILYKVFPIIIITLSLTSLIIIIWSSVVVKKIEKLKEKVDNIENDNYDHSIGTPISEELKSLELAIEDMRLSLKTQEEYRNQMYQNISHDFKTPLTVIKSYIEAVDDGVEDSLKAFTVIKEQTYKLEQKVHSLLYLNKLEYIKNSNDIKIDTINISEVLEKSVEKFKFQRADLKFTVSVEKNSKVFGSVDAWETVIDNIFSNFLRYAEKEIKVTVKKNSLVFYNDGPNIDDELKNVIFIPFRKGMKGQFGLGLSIIKKTLEVMGYDIDIKNHSKKGVSFIISKQTK